MNIKVELIWLLTSFIVVPMYAQSSGKKLNLDYHKQRVEVADTLCRIDTTVIPNKPVKNGKVTDVRFYTLEEYERILGVSNPSDEYFDTIYYLTSVHLNPLTFD